MAEQKSLDRKYREGRVAAAAKWFAENPQYTHDGAAKEAPQATAPVQPAPAPPPVAARAAPRPEAPQYEECLACQ